MHAVWTGKETSYIAALHAQYGEVVRVAPDELSFINPDAWRDIYGHGQGHGKNSVGSLPSKHWNWYSRPSNGVEGLIQAQNPHEHARVRRVFKPAFSDRALKEQEPLFLKYVNQLIGNLRTAVNEKPETGIDLVRNYNYTTFDVMGDLTFGEPLHMLDNSEYDPWVSLIFASVKFGSIFNLQAYYPWLEAIIQAILPPSFQKKKMEHFQYSADRVTKRLEKGRDSEGSDLWTRVLNQDEGKPLPLTRGEMDANAVTFMIAGTETTATLLSGLTYYLLQNPDKLRRLSTEIRSAFADPKDVSMETIAALPYMAACLKEALRLYPPVPIGLPHVTPANGTTICGRFVPPKTIVSAPHYVMYTSPLNFKDPLSFVPERWMGDERMAYHEMRLILTKLLYNFDLELCPESENWANQKTFSLWEKHPLMVKLKDVRA
ncbi:hypothetical protein E8E13_011362 [Curvularia kusanoi]|uniref:Uncharacterized protein n=1 Tax=Curvularia kusanoi TaxID=90978 RepID=A0A9P4TNW0_CURKU|nr:hypothetical protein E8E13_011362 [Curvularia kusanoi]